MYDDEEVIGKVTTEEQRSELMEMLSLTSDWLDDEGFDVDTQLYREKKVSVGLLSDPIFTRAEELDARPAAVAAARSTTNSTRPVTPVWSPCRTRSQETAPRHPRVDEEVGHHHSPHHRGRKERSD
jgi:hypoxia up-regulated 1